jgi:hypothetical protein
VRAFVAVTDKDWYQFLAGRPDLDEVNFWQPGGNRVFRALSPGEPPVQAHYPDNANTAVVSLLTFTGRGQPGLGCIRREEWRRRTRDAPRTSDIGARRPARAYQIGCIIWSSHSSGRAD